MICSTLTNIFMLFVAFVFFVCKNVMYSQLHDEILPADLRVFSSKS